MDGREETADDPAGGDRLTSPLVADLRAANEQLLMANLRVHELATDARDINERLLIAGLREQELAATLASERAQLAVILAGIADAVLVVDQDGRPVRTNAAYVRLFGHSDTGAPLDDAAGQPLPVTATVQARAGRGETFSQTFSVADDDGGRRWFEANGQPLPEGGRDHAVVVIRDITARRAAEDALRRAARENSLLAAAVANLETCVVITDPHQPDNPIVFYNPGFMALTGYAAADILGRNCRFLQGPDTDPETVGRLAAAIAAQRPFRDVILNYRRDGTPFWNEVVINPVYDADGRLTHFVGIQTDVTARIHLREELQHQALHDALTGLPNRLLFHDRARQALLGALHAGESLALLLLDLDGFKEVNDTFGHHVGDLLLQRVAERLQGGLREGDTVARLGGDEFAVLLPGDDRDGAGVTAAKIVEMLAAPIVVGGHTVRTRASIGIALYPDQGADADVLLRQADVAMYAAKRAKSGVAVYDPALDRHAPARQALIEELRAAIEGGGLCLHYQPMVDLTIGRVSRVEALARWPHPRRGLIPPDQFIPLAEQAGLIGPLTRWVVEEALRQWGVWQRAGLPLGVNVNLSLLNLHDATLVADIAGLLVAHTVAPVTLRLELTASAIITDMAHTATVLARFTALGVGIAIDDYGTGYSSLAYLQRLPIDELKIDQSFVRHLTTNETDATIMASTIGLAHSLGLRVVAEGAEDAATVTRLAALDCDAVQGYYYSRPLPPHALERWLRQRDAEALEPPAARL